MPQNLKNLIEQLGVTQNQVASLAGLGYGDFNQVVNGRVKRPKLSQAQVTLTALKQLAQLRQVEAEAEAGKVDSASGGGGSGGNNNELADIRSISQLHLGDITEFFDLRDDTDDIPGETVATRRNRHKREKREKKRLEREQARKRARAAARLVVDPEKRYRISEAAARLEIESHTLRAWDIQGKLKPTSVSEGGQRFYTERQLQEFLATNANANQRGDGDYRGNNGSSSSSSSYIGQSRFPHQPSPQPTQNRNRKTYLYVAAVATAEKTKADLELELQKQVATLTHFATAKGIVFDEVIIEAVTTSSNNDEERGKKGISNQTRPYFQRLLREVVTGQVAQVIVESASSLAQFNYNLVEQVFNQNEVEILVMSGDESSDQATF